MRLGLRALEKEYQKSEDDIKAIQSVGQIIAEVLKQLDEDKCKFGFFICFSSFVVVSFVSAGSCVVMAILAIASLWVKQARGHVISSKSLINISYPLLNTSHITVLYQQNLCKNYKQLLSRRRQGLATSSDVETKFPRTSSSRAPELHST